MSSKKEKILQKVNPKFLKMTPKLSGSSGSLIDLNSEENSLEDGARKLMMRFIKNQDFSERNKKNKEENDLEVIVSSVKYNDKDELCELISEKLTFPFAKEDVADFDCDKPGRKLQKLKMELQDKMSAKWEEEYKKRVKENESYNNNSKYKKKGFEEETLSDGENSIGENCESDGDEENEVPESGENEGDADDENESDGENENKDEKEEDDDEEELKLNNDNHPRDKSDDENNEEKEDEESIPLKISVSSGNLEDDLEACSLVPAYQPGGGLLYGGSELTQSEEGLPLNLLSPSLKFSITQSQYDSHTKSFDEVNDKNVEDTEPFFNVKNNLFQNSQNANDSFDLNDAFELCSGVFPDENTKSQLTSSETTAQDSSNRKILPEDAPVISEEADEVDEDDEAEEADFNDENQSKLHKKRKNIIEMEESEVEENLDSNDQSEDVTAVQKVFSDDEIPAVEENNGTIKKKNRKSLHFSDEEDEAGNADKLEEEEEEDVDGDDVEEEDNDNKSINYDSEENEIFNPREFFEKEAELSGSEWSGDEDERGLDEFDVEEGDADDLDNDQVRSQLEKIHIRRVLDDDTRQVRLIQEILFEDGDLYSDGKRRDRKFKWKNLGAFDDKENEAESNVAGYSSEEDCGDEEERRKLRHEKEIFLMEKKNNGNCSSDEEIVEENVRALKVTSVKSSVKLATMGQNNSGNLKTVDAGEMKKPLCAARGSFLTRNEEFLSRLAKATSAATDNVTGTKNSKNFVFATKSPEKSNSDNKTACKRQVEDMEVSIRREKKMKFFSKEIDTGPSILDLLFYQNDHQRFYCHIERSTEDISDSASSFVRI